VQEVWQECLNRFPDDAPGQEAAIQLLAQLYFANLLQYNIAADTAQLFQRYQKRKQRELGSRLTNIMFMRFPLLDPDRFLVRTLPVVGKLISWFGAGLWLLVVGLGVKVVADNWDAVRQQAHGVLATGNLPWLYASLILIKTIHEFGHAYFCRKFGGEVHAMGIMLMIFTPVPYVDATSAWSFRSRWQRLLVGAAGMIVELFFAALAAFIWVRTGEGAVHTLAYNAMIVASVSTLIFNLNPLLRFDGYYMLSDLLEIPNLTQRANQQLRYYVERGLFGVRKLEPPARTKAEAGWLTTFGITSGIYRIIVFAGILLVVADKFLIIGLLMAAVCAISWVAVPTWKFINYLASSPQLERVRPRAIAVSIGLAAVLVALLQFVPFPHHFRAPGVLRASERSDVINATAGYIVEVHVTSGTTVRAGQPLVRLQNRELELQLANTRAKRVELEARLLKATSGEIASVKPLQAQLAACEQELRKYQADAAALEIRARHDGVWVAPGIETLRGRWIVRGNHLGVLVNPAAFEFLAIVQQEDGDALFARRLPGAEVRINGQVAPVIAVQGLKVIPGEQRVLPSAALGWLAGGEVAVAADDPRGQRAAEPFFEVHAIVQAPAEIALLDGRSGKIRFDLAAEPLLPRWTRSLMQLLQKRYQL
jgi:putative peptide zinc metalloprotease protein